jgi:hypothetical protein
MESVNFFNYTAQPKYHLLTESTGYPSAQFSYPVKIRDIGGIVVREFQEGTVLPHIQSVGLIPVRLEQTE